MSKHSTLLQRALQRARAWGEHTEHRAAKVPMTERPIQVEDILTPEELANRLKMKVSWVRDQARSRTKHPIPFIRVGKYLRFNWADVVVWLQEQSSRNGRR